MRFPGADIELARDASVQAGKASAAAWHAIIGHRTFLLSVILGLAIGLAVLPLAGDDVRGALVALGAIFWMAFNARRAHLAETRAEDLQRRLDDEASYHAFVDSAVEGFFRTTRDGRYLICNPALAQIYGYETPNHLTAAITDIASTLYIDPMRREQFTALTEKNGSLQDFVSQIRRRDGAVIWISENARRVNDADGQFLFYEGTVEDITAKIESDLAMRHALQETQEAARAKAAFLSAMSHELKTPLNAVIGFSDLMLQGIFGPVEPERYRSYVADIHDNGRRLLGMINDILDLSRIEGRLMGLDEVEVSVLEALNTARAVAGSAQDQARIAIQVPLSLPLLKADPKRMRQILNHILSNAVKFTGKNGTITARAWLTQAGGIAIAVEDAGIGMEPAMISHALEPFKQLDSSLSRRFEGAGLGLPLANALTKLHGGKLAIESTPGAGTTVTIEFPPERTVELVLAVIA